MRTVPPMEPTKPPMSLALLLEEPESVEPEVLAAVGTVTRVVMVVSGRTLIVDTKGVNDVVLALFTGEDVIVRDSVELGKVDELVLEMVDDEEKKDEEVKNEEELVEEATENDELGDDVM